MDELSKCSLENSIYFCASACMPKPVANLAVLLSCSLYILLSYESCRKVKMFLEFLAHSLLLSPDVCSLKWFLNSKFFTMKAIGMS